MTHIKILIIEDEENLADALAMGLRFHSQEKFQVIIAHSGAEAAHLLAQQTEPFNIVISDLRLPDISGLALLARVRQMSSRTRTILITAFNSAQIASQAAPYTDAYLPKPFRLQDLLSLVQDVVREITDDENSTAILVEDEYPHIAACLHRLRQDITAPYAMLIDNNGHVMVDSGEPGQINKAILNALLCNSMAAASEVATAFNEPKSFDLHYYDGENSEIYCRKINESLFLALIVDLHRTQARMGTVWHSLKQAVQNIRAQTAELERMEANADDLMNDSFGDNLSAALSEALFSDW